LVIGGFQGGESGGQVLTWISASVIWGQLWWTYVCRQMQME